MLMLSNGLDGLWLCRLFRLVWVILGSFCCCAGCLKFLVCWMLFSSALGMCGVVFLDISRCFGIVLSFCCFYECFWIVVRWLLHCVRMVFEFMFLCCCWEVFVSVVEVALAVAVDCSVCTGRVGCCELFCFASFFKLFYIVEHDLCDFYIVFT